MHLLAVVCHLGAAISGFQQWWLMNVLLNTLVGMVLNEGKKITLFKVTMSIFLACMFMGLTLFLAHVLKVPNNNNDNNNYR